LEVDVCPIDELPSGSVKIVNAGEFGFCVYNLDGELHAIEDRCSHDDGPLCEGEVDFQDYTVICPRHGSKFEIKTGRVLNPPAYAPVETFPVRVDANGMIKVEVD
jgi:3-phenylpropionate/trans-cinnamate dioxygenase ferredoxin subunit